MLLDRYTKEEEHWNVAVVECFEEVEVEARDEC